MKYFLIFGILISLFIFNSLNSKKVFKLCLSYYSELKELRLNLKDIDQNIGLLNQISLKGTKLIFILLIFLFPLFFITYIGMYLKINMVFIVILNLFYIYLQSIKK